mgnify:CR=1 FL=1
MSCAIGRQAGASVVAPEAVTTRPTRDHYLLSSLMEEAITSSQMEGEGAATTRDVAKAMIRSRRPPRDRSEQMILNNFLTMQRIRELRNQPLTPQLVLDLHRLVTEGTLDVTPPMRAGCAPSGARTAAEAGRALPLCQRQNPEGVHPPSGAGHRSALLAGLRPSLSDGNGRTARALFYWAMLQQGYWLFEFTSISSVINKARGHYERSFLLSESDDNELTYFLLAQVKVIL